MKQFLRNEATRALVVLMLLLALKGVHAAGWLGATLQERGGVLVSTMSSRDLNKEAREALTAGYYEGLINEGSRLGAMNRLLTDSRRPTFEDRAQPDHRQTNTFLFYELIPNSDVPDYADERFRYRRKTNSAGLADREYTLAKPAGTHRIALLGDSVTRGQGAPFLGNYESLLEDALNAPPLTTGRRVEILNFAVGSYSVMQMLDAAIVKAAPYDPDVYVVALTDLNVYRSWGHHFALLLNAGIDLKYEHLRNVARQAGLKPGDPLGVVDARLARFRIPTIRWALGELKTHAHARGAQVVVLLVPSVDDPAILREEFLGVREIIGELGMPTIDLLETFADLEDRAPYRVNDRDRHPNAAGHRLLFERLREKIVSNPTLTRVFVDGLPPRRTVD